MCKHVRHEGPWAFWTVFGVNPGESELTKGVMACRFIQVRLCTLSQWNPHKNSHQIGGCILIFIEIEVQMG